MSAENGSTLMVAPRTGSPQVTGNDRERASQPPRLVLSVDEAADALSVSRDSFERHVMAELRLVRIGRRLLVPVQELERWIEREMAIPLVAELSDIRSRRRIVEGM